MLFVYGGIAAGLALGEQGSSPGLDGRQKSSRDLSFLAAEAFFSEGSAFPLWLNRNERAPHAAQWRCQSRWRQQVCVVQAHGHYCWRVHVETTPAAKQVRGGR